MNLWLFLELFKCYSSILYIGRRRGSYNAHYRVFMNEICVTVLLFIHLFRGGGAEEEGRMEGGREMQARPTFVTKSHCTI